MRIRMNFDGYTLRSNGFTEGTKWEDKKQVSAVDENGKGMYVFSLMLVDNENPTAEAQRIQVRINLDSAPEPLQPFTEVFLTDAIIQIKEFNGKLYQHFEATGITTEKPQAKTTKTAPKTSE